jgi:hypothetical protein
MGKYLKECVSRNGPIKRCFYRNFDNRQPSHSR